MKETSPLFCRGFFSNLLIRFPLSVFVYLAIKLILGTLCLTYSAWDLPLFCRYDTMTILKLLQEMAYYAKPKMDWNELVKKTTTGITNAREYQLLWRHLAYRDSLLPVEDDAQLPVRLISFHSGLVSMICSCAFMGFLPYILL